MIHGEYDVVGKGTQRGHLQPRPMISKQCLKFSTLSRLHDWLSLCSKGLENYISYFQGLCLIMVGSWMVLVGSYPTFYHHWPSLVTTGQNFSSGKQPRFPGISAIYRWLTWCCLACRGSFQGCCQSMVTAVTVPSSKSAPLLSRPQPLPHTSWNQPMLRNKDGNRNWSWYEIKKMMEIRFPHGSTHC